jgi:preprotein translocase subunit SecD
VLRQLPLEGTTLEDLGVDPNATTTTTTAAPDSTTTTPPESTTTTVPQTDEERRKELEDAYGIGVPTTPSDQDTADATVVLPEFDRKSGDVNARYELGPAPPVDPNDPSKGYIVGTSVDSAEARYSTQTGWIVAVNLEDGDGGADQINALATECRAGDSTGITPCPGNQQMSCNAGNPATGCMAIVLDGRIQFAGVISSPDNPPFPNGELTIQGGYTKSEANDIALALKYGSLPVELEPQSTQTVSATLGNDAKNAGIIAAIVGLSLVAIYVLLYYRLLGAVALVSLVLSAGLLWAVIAYLGETRGLALTLAGITGLIVSIGVSLDSNIVYFEHMKEDIRNGRTPRSASSGRSRGR